MPFTDPNPTFFYSVVLWELIHKVAALTPNCNAKLARSTVHNMACENKTEGSIVKRIATKGVAQPFFYCMSGLNPYKIDWRFRQNKGVYAR
mmetsp:Transcript_111991/g.321819  ORF Transcript_111991/g.321819 Transcript_111991/m.321819 type:complete len:91 (+) Transcript_111991:237-509(+)